MEPTTLTSTQVVTISEEETSTEVEPETTTVIESETEAETETETEAETDTDTDTGSPTTTTATGTATGAPPYRPTGTSTITSSPKDTQTGCPTGFYGCLATHGGGCCRTDRDCNTYDCPAPSTTIISDGATIVILATDAPPVPRPTSTCAGGWFLCGADAGPVAGCCPSGYECGTASCFTAGASQTAIVQKEFPVESSAARGRLGAMIVGVVFVVMMMI